MRVNGPERLKFAATHTYRPRESSEINNDGPLLFPCRSPNRRDLLTHPIALKFKVDGVDYVRRLDIADESLRKGVEYKTGYQTATADNLSELARDADLAKDGWTIEWVFRDTASQPLKDALTRAGISYRIGH